MDFLISKAPFLALPVVNPILGLIVGEILSIAIKESAIGIYFAYTDMRVGKQGQDFEAAALRNQAAQASGTKEEKAAAEKALIDSLRAFGRINS